MKTQRFIAIGTQVIVRNHKSTQAVAHTTKTELDVTAERNLQNDVECPLTGEQVCRISRDGFDVFFPLFKVRSRVVIESGDVDESLLNEQLSMLQYDVPARGPSAGFSPCARLYGVAVPMTESVWLVRSGDVPWNFINEMLDMGVSVDVTKLDPSETRNKVARALQFLEDKLAEKIANAEASMERARQKLERSEADGVTEEDALEAFNRQAAVIEARLRKWLKDVDTGTSRFGIHGNAFHLSRLGDRATSLRSAMNEQARAYSRATEVLAQVGTSDAAALVTLAQNDQLPVVVLAEALHDAGQSDIAEALQAAFNEENEFSLVGSDDEE